MSTLAKGLLGDFQAVVGIEACCSCAGYSQMIVEMMQGWSGRSRSFLENDLLMKNQGEVGRLRLVLRFKSKNIIQY